MFRNFTINWPKIIDGQTDVALFYEGHTHFSLQKRNKAKRMDLNMKPSLAADEMFSEGPGYMEMDESGSATGMMLDHLPANDKHAVHADFYNDFDDLLDDDNWDKIKNPTDNVK